MWSRGSHPMTFSASLSSRTPIVSLIVSFTSRCARATARLHSYTIPGRQQRATLARPKLPRSFVATDGKAFPSQTSETAKRKSAGSLPSLKGTAPSTEGAVPLLLSLYYLRRRIAYVRMPEPSSSAAAGNARAGPPLGARPGAGVGVGVGVGVCAKATGARTSISTSTSVARNIALFIQSSFSASSSKTTCNPSPDEKVPALYRTQTQKSPLF
jgi:hypothetical protein